jgi:hypothetical protein
MLKILKFFKSMIGMQKQTLSHWSRIFYSYVVEFNCKLFFVSSTYFIYFLYLKRKEWKCWVLNNLFQAFKINFFLYALWMKILILCFHPSIRQFLKGFIFFKFEMLLHDLIVKVCYNKSLFYIITIIIIYEKLKFFIIRENF